MSDSPETASMNRDPFELLEEAGVGGMGTVYRARDRATGRILAVKMLTGRVGEISRFKLEAQVLARLGHPAIVGYVYHGVAAEGRPYLAMEWLEGQSLEARVKDGALEVDETLRIARVIAEALGVAHAHGVVHRDLKPSNVFLTTDGDVKLLDFGIAKLADVEGLTETGAALGTPGYMSPEQARGSAVDGRSDLFSLGCLIFRALGGRRPFEGSDLMAYATTLALDDPPKLGEVAPNAPPALEALVAKMLAKDKADRPPNAAAVVAAIDRIMADPHAATERAPEPARAPKTLRVTEAPAISVKKIAPPSTVEPTMRSPIPDHTRKSGPPEDETPPRSRTLSLAIAGAIALVVAFGLFEARQIGVFGPGARPAPAPAASGEGPLVRDSDRVALDRACREWSSIIARGQRADGAFASDPHADASGWDTAQQLYALTEAQRACSGVGPAPLAAGASALDRMRVDDGWIGPRRPSAPNYADKRSETPAIAWALLALAGVRRETGDAALDPSIARARADLLRARQPDGGFRYVGRGTDVSTLYSTMLATWALVETDKVHSPETKSALAWLRKELAPLSDTMRVQGVTEQVAWILARAERVEPGGRDALTAAATEIVAHCRLDRTTCARPTYDTGKIPLGAGAGNLVTLWHPWATVSAYELARDPSPLGKPDTEIVRALFHVARWGNGELGGAVTSLATAPEYKLAEYLLAVAKTLEPH